VQKIISLDYLLEISTRLPFMLTLYVEGIPAIKLGDKSEIPARQGNESWKVIDAKGNVIATYL
jgi:hypothetical protein